MTRSERLAELIEEHSQLLENGYEIPAEPSKYFLLEKNSGDAIWGYDEDTLEECAQQIDDAEESQFVVYDLDSLDEIVPIVATIGFLVPTPSGSYEKHIVKTTL